jgi:5-methylcytosine-specific restriction endonuclease McrA
MSQEVLVLNNDYEPLNICNMRRAVILVFLGKADVLHAHTSDIRSVSGRLTSPSVVRLRHHVKRPLPRLKLSRRSIFARDNYTCQYCGQRFRDLTLDHIVPKRLGGETTWENLVCCCHKCNSKKAGKTLEQTGMMLAKKPRRPRYVPFISLTKYIEGTRNDVWRGYLPLFGEIASAPEKLD